MKTRTNSAGDCLFHPVHGMYRIDRLIHSGRMGDKKLSYSLVPKIARGMKVRIVIEAEQMEASGFHGPVSIKEANAILAYLKAGDGSAVQTQKTWLLAQTILNFKAFPPQEQRKRQALEYSAKGLTSEFACVFNITLKEASCMIKKSLAPIPKTNSPVFAALARAGEE